MKMSAIFEFPCSVDRLVEIWLVVREHYRSEQISKDGTARKDGLELFKKL